MEVVSHHSLSPLHSCPADKTSGWKHSNNTTVSVFAPLRRNELWRFRIGSAPVSNCCKGSRHHRPASCKMFVPESGSQSPEARAAETLHHYFTYLAVKIVLAQLEEYNPDAYTELREFADKTSLNDGDKFCAALMRESPRHKGLALRILDVRSAYASNDFEWENMKRLAIKLAEKSNTNLMRQFLVDTSDME